MVPKAGDETHILAGPRTGVNSGRCRGADSGCSRGIRTPTRPPTRATSSTTSRISRGSAARSVAGSRRRRARGAATAEERRRRSSSVVGPRGTRSSPAVDVPAARTSGGGRSACDAASGRFTRTGTRRKRHETDTRHETREIGESCGYRSREIRGQARRTMTSAPRPSPRRSTALAALAAISRWSVLPKSAHTSPSPISA
jgi:hypothetical protein